MKSTIVIAALAGAAFGTASATPRAEEPRQEVVGYADLDLSQHEAAVTLYQRRGAVGDGSAAGSIEGD